MKPIMLTTLAYGAANVGLYGILLTHSGRQADVQKMTIVLPFLLYFISLYYISRKTWAMGTSYHQLIRNGFKLAIGISMGWFLPWFVFGVTPDGQIKIRSITDFILYIVYMLLCLPFAAMVTGALLGLFGMVMINQLYGGKTREEKSPNNSVQRDA